MHAEAIEKVEFFRQRRTPDFSQLTVLESEVELVVRAEDFHRQRVEKFVGEDDQRCFASARPPNRTGAIVRGRGLSNRRAPVGKMLAHRLLQFGAERGRGLLQRVSQRTEKIWKLFLRPVQNVPREEATSGA